MFRLSRGLVLAGCLAAGVPAALVAQRGNEPQTGRPRITLRAQPNVAVSPARVVMTAELVGGANDYEEYYCPTIEWDWGDDTISESSSDCDPYVAGTSEIRRRYTIEHRFRRPGTFKVFIRLKQRDREVGTASTTVTIRPGAPD